MSSFSDAVRHCLRNLATFRGRDTRSQFWFYVLALFIAQQILTVVIAALLIFGVIGPAFGADTSPDPTTFFATFRLFMAAALAIPIVAIVLLAAALVRRLHDRGLSGWWASMPLPFLLFGTVAFIQQFSTFNQPEPTFDHGLFGLMFVNNAVYLATLLALVVLLVKESDPRQNRYGEPPSFG